MARMQVESHCYTGSATKSLNTRFLSQVLDSPIAELCGETSHFNIMEI
jgi:hypothetical protein